MASRVNTKFVILLAVVLVGLAGAVTGVGYFSLRHSGESLIKDGDAFMAAGETEKAISAYGRAVSKDQKNVAWIRKWLGALESSTPATRVKYLDQYQSQFMLALRGLARADSGNLEAQRRLADEGYNRMLLVNGGQNGWEGLIQSTDELIARFTGDAKGKDILRRYKGLARSGLVQIGTELRPEDRTAAYADLDAALAADPTDADSLIAWATIKTDESERLRRKNEVDKADQMMAQIRDRLEGFIKDHPPAAVIRMARFRMELGATARQQTGAFTMKSLIEANKGLFDAMVEAFRAEPAEKVSVPAWIGAATTIGASGPEGILVSRELLEKAYKARPDNAPLLLGWGKLEAGRGELEPSLSALQKLVDLPQRPLSLEGVLLHDLQAEAIKSMADVTFARWERETTDVAKKAELEKQAKKLRDDYVARVGQDNNATLSLDARLAFIAGDTDKARTLLDRYNERTGQADVQSLLLQAQLLMRTGSAGAAQQTYERVLQLDPQNVGALYFLGQLESGRQDWASAARHLCTAAQLRPNDVDLQKQCEAASAMAQATPGADSKAGATPQTIKDPVLRVLFEAQEKLKGVNPDSKGAMAVIREGIKTNPKDPRLPLTLAQLQMNLNDRAGAIQTMKDAQTAMPDDARFAQALKNIDVADPAQAGLDQINAEKVSDLEKAIARFNLFIRLNKPEEAKGALAEAAKLGPEDARVIDLLFREALTAKDIPEIERLVTLAEKLNIDAVNGLWYRSRRAAALNNLDEAAPLLRQVTEKDRNNPEPWRLLGAVYLRQGQNASGAERQKLFESAVEVLDRAVKIRPQDVSSIVAYLEATTRSGRLVEALRFARASEQFAASNPEYREYRLQLEADAPGGDRETALSARTKRRAEDASDRNNNTQLVALLINDRKWDEAQKLIDELKPTDGTPDPMVIGLQGSWWVRQAVGERGAVDTKKLDEAKKVYRAFFDSLPADKRRYAYYSNAARELISAGDIDGAVEILNAGRSLQDPKMMEADRELGDLQFQAGRFEDAMKTYRALLSSGTPNPDNLITKRVIECLLALSKFDEIDAEMAKLGDEAQKDPTLLLLAAQAGVQQKDRVKARRLFDQAIAAGSAAGRTPSAVAFIRRAEFNEGEDGLRKDVIADLEQALKIAPGNNVARARLANILVRDGQFDQAVEVGRTAIKNDPFDNGMREALVDLLKMRQRDAEVFDVIDEAVKLSPDGVEWLINGGDIASQLGRWSQAEGYYRKVFEKVKRADIALKFSNALLQQTPSKCTEALSVLANKELNTDKTLLLVLTRARALIACNKAAEALQDVKAASGLFNPDDPEQVSMFFAGFTLVYPKPKDQLNALGRMEKETPFTPWMKVQSGVIRLQDPDAMGPATDELKKLAASTQDNLVKISIYKLLGSTAYQAKKWESAVEMFRRGLEVDPDDVELNNNIAFTLAKQLNRAAEALTFAEHAAKIRPEYPTILDSLGVVQLELKKYEDADKTLTRAQSLATKDEDRTAILVHLADARMNLSRRKEAQELLRQAGEIVANNSAARQLYQEDLKRVQNLLDSK